MPNKILGSRCVIRIDTSSLYYIYTCDRDWGEAFIGPNGWGHADNRIRFRTKSEADAHILSLAAPPLSTEERLALEKAYGWD